MLASAGKHTATARHRYPPCLSHAFSTGHTSIASGARAASSAGVPRRHGLTSKAWPQLVRYRQGEEVQATVHSVKPSIASNSATAQPPSARSQLKVIGLGLRGISAVNRLIGSGTLQEAEFWALDSDKRVLSSADPTAHVLEVGPGDDASLGPADLAALSGSSPAAPAAAAAAPPQGSEVPDGQAGAVFVLGSAFGSPGGAPMLLQLVRYLRRQGYFVAAALTRPFDFEGARRLEAADTLISTLEEVAHLVVVISQGVLTRASAELTMAQAQAIADNTLVYTVQSTLWALRAPEVLKVSHGVFLWHGRDLRNIKRPLFPPMMNLLSCPGHATLGRGQAALPLPLLQQAGLASALSTLAEDAVKAASESPFLDNKLEGATGVLCVLRVPPSALGVSIRAGGKYASGGAAHGGPIVADNHKEYALRSAVQVAAMTVKELVGPHCHDIIVCPQLCHDLEAPQQQQEAAGGAADGSGGSGGTVAADRAPGRWQSQQQQVEETPIVRVEVSLLVLEAIEEAAEARAIAGHKSPLDNNNNSSTGAAAAASSNASAASSAPPTPTAATARDRMASVIGTRSHPPVTRLPNSFGATTTANGGAANRRQPVQQPPLRPTTSGASAAAPAGTATASGSGYGNNRSYNNNNSSQLGRTPPSSTSSAASSSTPTSSVHPSAMGTSHQQQHLPYARQSAPNASHSPSVSSSVPATAPAAGSAGAAAGPGADSNSASARKQARLAAMSAMSALAGGTGGPGIHGGVHGGAVGGAGAGGGYANGSAGAGVGSTWGRPAGNNNSSGGAWNAAGNTARGYPQQQQQQQPQLQAGSASSRREGGAGMGPQQIPRMSENLVTSLVAQSLDLPPQAARWRHQHRAPPSARGTRPPVFQLPKVDADLHDADDGWADGSQAEGETLGRGLHQFIMGMRLPVLGSADGNGSGAGGGPAAVRNRVAGMLDREREDP